MWKAVKWGREKKTEREKEEGEMGRERGKKNIIPSLNRIPKAVNNCIPAVRRGKKRRKRKIILADSSKFKLKETLTQ